MSLRKDQETRRMITQLHCTLLDQMCILLFKSMLFSVANGWLARICCTLGVCVASWWPHYVFSCVTRLHCKSVRRWLVGVCVWLECPGLWWHKVVTFHWTQILPECRLASLKIFVRHCYWSVCKNKLKNVTWNEYAYEYNQSKCWNCLR